MHTCLGNKKKTKTKQLYAVCSNLQSLIQLDFWHISTSLFPGLSDIEHSLIPLGYLLISPALSEVAIYPVSSEALPYKIFPLIKMQVPDSFHTFDLKKFHAFSTLKSLSSLIQMTSLTSFLNFSKFILLKLRS